MSFRRLLFLMLVPAFLGPWQMKALGNEPTLDTLRRANEGLRRFVLDNGLVGLVKEDHSAPVAAMQIWVRRGSVHEQEWLGAGLSHFVEHMIFKGTPTRAPGEISRAIGDLGGDLNAYTTLDRTVFHVTLPSRSWREGLDVLADAVMNASFPEEEWAREREVILREFAMHRDQPDRELNRLLWATAFQVHPYRVPVIGYEEVFSSVTREDLAAFFRRHYTPDNMIVALVGDVDADAAEARLREVFTGFARRAGAPVLLPTEPAQQAPREERRTGPYEVTRLRMAWPTVAMSHSNAPALDVLAAVTGSGRSSRLVSELKEKRQLAFSLGAWSFTPQDAGLFGVSGTCDPAKEKELIQALEEEIAGWANRPFTEEELAKARRQVLVAELSRLEDMAGQAASYAAGEFYAVDPRFGERYLDQVARVTALDVREAARLYLAPERRTLVVLAPESAAPSNAPAATPAAPGEAVRRLALSNGLPLLVREDRRLPFVQLCVVLRGGLLSEDESRVGLTPLLAELLTRGTASRSASDIAELVESRGGSFSAFSGWNSFGLQARCLTPDAELFMGLAADSLLRPALSEEEIEKQRALQVASILQQREQPMFIAQQALQAQLFPGHPYRWMASGTPETLAAVTRADLLDYLERHRAGGNIVLAVFGDVAAEEALAWAEKHFGALPPGEAPPLPSAAPSPALPTRSLLEEPRRQTILLAGYPGVDVFDPRSDAVSVLQDILSGLSSDLGIEVRDRRGLAYFVGAMDRQGLQPGFFALYAGVRPETIEETERLMAEQVARLREDGPREDEFRRAVEQLVAGHQMRLQDNAGLAQLCALHELYGLGYRHGLDAETRLRGLTPADVRAAAREILDPERQAVSIVQPIVETSTGGEEP